MKLLTEILSGSVAVRDEPRFGEIEIRFLVSLHLLQGELDQDVGLDVYRGADSERVEVSAQVGEREDGDGDGVVLRPRRRRTIARGPSFDSGDGEAYAFNGDGAFGDHPPADAGGDADLESPIRGVAIEIGAGLGDDGIEGGEDAGCIDVTLNDVAAEGTAGGRREFEVHFGAGFECTEGRAVECLPGEVGVEVGWFDIEGSEADAGDSEGVAFAESASYAGGFDGDAANAAAVSKGDEGAGLLDNAGEHASILSE
jgi:hypothetical protein